MHTSKTRSLPLTTAHAARTGPRSCVAPKLLAQPTTDRSRG